MSLVLADLVPPDHRHQFLVGPVPVFVVVVDVVVTAHASAAPVVVAHFRLVGVQEVEVGGSPVGCWRGRLAAAPGRASRTPGPFPVLLTRRPAAAFSGRGGGGGSSSPLGCHLSRRTSLSFHRVVHSTVLVV